MPKMLINFTLLTLIFFALAKVLFEAALRRWGDRWNVRGIADPAGVPLLALIIVVISFVLTPINNSLIRVAEVEADLFGLNAAREPDGFAQVALKLGTYRKLDPTPLEEFVFFDHPSGRARIRMAMDWKAAKLPAGGAE
jgi:STE24 endopeptidase